MKNKFQVGDYVLVKSGKYRIYQNGTWGLQQQQQHKENKEWERKIKCIDLVFENCESARLEIDMFYGLAIRGIKKNYNINCAQYKNGEYWESTTCEAFYITINEKGLKEAKFNSPQFDENETLKTRLDKWKDITHVHIYFEDENDEYISVPWKGEEDSRYNMTNECQFHDHIKNTENDLIDLAIEIRK